MIWDRDPEAIPGNPYRPADVEIALDLAEAQVAEYARDTAHKDYCGGGPYKALDRLRAIKAFIEAGAEVHYHSPGLVRIGDKVVALRNKKFQFPGNPKWYRYSTPEGFMEKWANT